MPNTAPTTPPMPAALRDGLTPEEQRAIAREQDQMNAAERAFYGISDERAALLEECPPQWSAHYDGPEYYADTAS